jgi:hypothetical protein
VKLFTAYAIVWVATAGAVVAGIIVTKSPGCLWALLLPAMLEIKGASHKEDDDD